MIRIQVDLGSQLRDMINNVTNNNNNNLITYLDSTELLQQGSHCCKTQQTE